MELYTVHPVKFIKIEFIMIFKLVIFVVLTSLQIKAEVMPFKGEFSFKGPVLTLSTVRELTINDGVGTFDFYGNNALGNLRISSTFENEKNVLKSMEYEFKAKAALIINRKQKLLFGDNISSSGDHTWVIESSTLDHVVLDPLTAQIQLSLEISRGENVITLFLPNLKNGAIEENKFEQVGTELLEIDGVSYECALFQRIRENDNRITKYWFAKSLNYMLIKTIDVDDNGTVELAMTKLLSFG